MEKTLKKLSSETLSFGFGAPFPWDNYSINHEGEFVNTNFEIWGYSLFCTNKMKELHHFCAF